MQSRAHRSRTTVVVAAFLAGAALLQPAEPSADPVAVRHAEGLVHGFLSLRSLDGTMLASGDLIQNARGDRVTTRLVFRFKDGSTHDETALREDRGLVVQKGPSFE